jgi:CheY-like chemotaxis protein
MNKPRILIVDDEKAIRDSYRSILTTENAIKSIEDKAASLFDQKPDDSISNMDDLLGLEDGDTIIEEDLETGHYEIDESDQGMGGVEMVEDSLKENCPYSLVFMDVRMPPGIDGVEAAGRIRKLDPHIEIVIMTAYSDYNLEEIVDKVGNPDRLLYFHKPFHSQQIKHLASSLTQHWTLEQKRRQQD